ncbi:MAG: RNA methyltransferase [Bacteroidota bacterium]
MTISKKRMNLVRSLARKKNRDQNNLFLVEGLRLTREAVLSDFEIEEAYYTSGILNQPGGHDLVRDLERKARRIQKLTSKELQSFSSTVTTQGVLALVRKRMIGAESMLLTENVPHLIVACDAISDPGNLGSIIRTCDWFAVDGLLLGRSTVDLTNPKVVRGTMGGIFRVPIAEEVDLQSTLQEAERLGYSLYLSDPEGALDAGRVVFERKVFVVFGNEAHGFSEGINSLAGRRLRIPRYGKAESLNVGVACGVVLSAIRQARKEMVV